VESSGEVLRVGRQRRWESGFLEGVSVDYELVVPPELAASIDTSSGEVEVQRLQGAVQVDSASGNVTLRQVGAAQVNSSSGDVVLEGIAGDIDVDSSSGNVEVHASPSPHARWKIDSSSGDVTLAVGPGSAFHLDAATASGSVKSELPIRVRGTFSSDELHGEVGEGASQAEVKVDTASGDIHLR
jgi:DUF4097 and DUF4098 domain-containing protein YvlB